MTLLLCSGRPWRRHCLVVASSATLPRRVRIRCLGASQSLGGCGRVLLVGVKSPGLCALLVSSPNTILIMSSPKIPNVDHFTLFIPATRVPLVWFFVTLVPWWSWYPSTRGFQPVSFGLN
jgi:hypothetical protein